MVLWQFLIALDTSLLLIDVLPSYTLKGWMFLSHTMKVILSMQLRTFLWCTHVLEVARRRCYENLDNLIWQNLCLVLQVTQDAIKVILTWRPPRMLPRYTEKKYKNRSRPRRRRDGQHVTSVTKKTVFSRVSSDGRPPKVTVWVRANTTRRLFQWYTKLHARNAAGLSGGDPGILLLRLRYVIEGLLHGCV